MATAAQTIHADINAPVSDSNVVFGNGNTQVSTGGGDSIINHYTGPVPAPRRRANLAVRPRKQALLLGRDDEIASALEALGVDVPVQFHGAPGLGKTALLRHLARIPVDGCPEGVVYYGAARTSLDDLLQILFDLLWESDLPIKRERGALVSGLAGWRLLLLLDDLELAEHEIDALLDIVSESLVVIGSPAQSLGDGEVIALGGLARAPGLQLVEKKLRRQLEPVERDGLDARWAQISRPAQLVMEADRLRGGGGTDERVLLAVTAAANGAAVGIEHIAAVTNDANAGAKLAGLEDRDKTSSHSPRYSITAQAALTVDPAEVEAWRPRLLAHLTAHAEGHREQPERLREDLDPILELLRWGQVSAPHADVLRLARATDTVAARAGRWDAWREILGIGLTAARAIGDRGGEAWALHQLGTRALCLEDMSGARSDLQEALDLRDALGDRSGAANTRHNMGFLAGGGPVAPRGMPLSPLPIRAAWALPAVLPLLVVIAVIALSGGGPGPDAVVPQPPPTPTPIACTGPDCAPAPPPPSCEENGTCVPPAEDPVACALPGACDEELPPEIEPPIVVPPERRPRPRLEPGSVEEPRPLRPEAWMQPATEAAAGCDYTSPVTGFLREQPAIAAQLLDEPPAGAGAEVQSADRLLNGRPCGTPSVRSRLGEALLPQSKP